MDQTRPEPYVGFIWHFPFSRVGTEALGRSGANALMARLNYGAICPAAGEWRFDTITEQLHTARRHGLKLVLLLEINAFCAPKWLTEACREAGEGTCGWGGVPGSMARADSLLLQAHQRELLTRLKAFLDAHDAQRTVTHYVPGIEWWFPESERYAPHDVLRFRQWLRQRYAHIDVLNARWNSRIGDWSEVPAPLVRQTDYPYAQNRRGLAGVAVEFPGVTDPPRGLTAVAVDWAGFWYATAAQTIERLAALTREIDPSRPVVSYLTFGWAQVAEWDYVDWSCMRTDHILARSRSHDVHGLQLCFARGDTFRLTAGLDLARKYGKPVWDWDLLDFVDGVRAGWEVHEKATHAAIQHGAEALFYCCWNGAKDFEFYPDWPVATIARMTRDARQALKLTQRYRVAVDGALLDPIVPGAPGDELFGRNRVNSLMGWYHLLERITWGFDMVTLDEIENGWVDLSRYRWLLIPDCACCSDAVTEIIERFRRAGGRVIAGGRYATHTERGEVRRRRVAVSAKLPDWGRQYAGEYNNRQGDAGDTPPQMIWRRETLSHRETLAAVRHVLPGLLGVRPICELHTDQDVRGVLWRDNRRWLLYLVNHELSLAEGVTLRWPGAAPGRVTVVTDGRSGSAKLTHRVLPLPNWRSSCIIMW